jgi:hypothetical protein
MPEGGSKSWGAYIKQAYDKLGIVSPRWLIALRNCEGYESPPLPELLSPFPKKGLSSEVWFCFGAINYAGGGPINNLWQFNFEPVVVGLGKGRRCSPKGIARSRRLHLTRPYNPFPYLNFTHIAKALLTVADKWKIEKGRVGRDKVRG